MNAPLTASRPHGAGKRAHALRALAVLPCLLGALAAPPATAAAIDTAKSDIGFTLRTRWGQVLEGRFPHYKGEIAVLPDGRQQVRLELSTRDVEIVGNKTYTKLTRGRGFFDAEHFPTIEFVSEPFPARLMREGGALPGALRIRGMRRTETFEVEQAACPKPARECDVIARGSIDRNDYGVDRWRFALSGRVVFRLRVRTLPES
ncbi:YceI family protein [Luteimonas aquatica]|uniref:YceI family protein n=1 Tax=Luteimonas aquatica TaxID=450364 RepID=UPI001F58D3DB|nr:YceI family protein [Luteimonas aquatica]